MSLRAPIAIPVEVSVDQGVGARRVFRLAASVGEDGVRLLHAAPFDVGRPVRVRFVLPGPSGPSTDGAGALELDAEVLHADHDDEARNEDAAGRELTFLHPSAEARLAIRAYVRARLDLP
jgi:hypothetical protein